jgi:hypothetical protein
MRTWVAWIVGLSLVAALVALIGWLVPDDEVRRPMWVFIFAALAASAVFAWSHPEAPETPSGWLGYVGAAFVGGFFLVGVDVLMFVRVPSGGSFTEAVLSSGWVLFDLVAIVGGAIVAAGGWAYSLVRKPNET